MWSAKARPPFWWWPVYTIERHTEVKRESTSGSPQRLGSHSPGQCKVAADLSCCHNRFEARRLNAWCEKGEPCKARKPQPAMIVDKQVCPTFNCVCGSRIGLTSQKRVHLVRWHAHITIATQASRLYRHPCCNVHTALCSALAGKRVPFCHGISESPPEKEGPAHSVRGLQPPLGDSALICLHRGT